MASLRPEISVSLEQLVCFYLLDTVNYVTYYAFLFGGPPLADVYWGVQILPRTLFSSLSFFQPQFIHLIYPFRSVYFVHRIKSFVKWGGKELNLSLIVYFGFFSVYYDREVDNLSHNTHYKRLKQRFSIKLVNFNYFKKAFHSLTAQNKWSTIRYQGHEWMVILNNLRQKGNKFQLEKPKVPQLLAPHHLYQALWSWRLSLGLHSSTTESVLSSSSLFHRLYYLS